MSFSSFNTNELGRFCFQILLMIYEHVTLHMNTVLPSCTIILQVCRLYLSFRKRVYALCLFKKTFPMCLVVDKKLEIVF